MKIKEDIIPTLKVQGVVTPDNVYVGARVKRGPDWQWDNQDEYGEGTIIQYSNWWAKVLWHNNRKSYGYRVFVTKHDLIFA